MSTSAGVGDYRGPSGAWTQRRIKELQRLGPARSAADAEELRRLLAEQGKEQSKATVQVPMTDAQPSLTHMMQATLIRNGLAHFVVTTNLDGIYRKAGLQAHDQVCFLHGDVYTERCTACGYDFERNWHTRQGGTAHVHDHSIGTCSRCGSKPPKGYTGRPKAGARTGADGNGFKENGLVGTRDANVGTKDTHINFGEFLDERDWKEAELHCSKADLCIVMGTSMSLRHITHFPFQAKRTVIVNLQKTPDDGKCSLRIWAQCDPVSAGLLARLGLEPMPVPVWRPRDGLPLSEIPAYVSKPYRDAAKRLEEVATRREREAADELLALSLAVAEPDDSDAMQAAPRRRCPSRSVPRGRAKTDASRSHSRPREVVETVPETLGARVDVGNAHELLGDGKHAWRLYVAGDGAHQLSRVEVWLHPTFQQNHFNLETLPFQLQCTGWGTFDIRLRLHKKAGGHADVTWPLQFQQDDAHSSFDI